MNYYIFQISAFPAMQSLSYIIRAKMAGVSHIYHFPGLRSFLSYPGLLKSDPYRVFRLKNLQIYFTCTSLNGSNIP